MVLAVSSDHEGEHTAYVVKAGLAEPLSDLTVSDMVVCRRRSRGTRGEVYGISRLDWLRRGRAAFQGKLSQAAFIGGCWGLRIGVQRRHVTRYCIATIVYQRKKDRKSTRELDERELVSLQSLEDYITNQERAQHPSSSINFARPITLHDSNGGWRRCY